MITWTYASSSCPLCQVERRAEAVHIRWLQIENCRQPATWFHLRDAAYCPRHAAVVREGTGAELSALFEFLTREELAQLRARRDQNRPGRRLRQAWRRLWTRQTRSRARGAHALPACPACEAGEVAVGAEIHSFLRLLETEEGRKAYRAGAGLCRRHFAQVVEEAPETLARWLEQDLEARLLRSLEEYQQYFHLLDYRFRHEPRGREQTAWLRSLLYFWGLPDQPAAAGGHEDQVPEITPRKEERP